MAALSCHVRPIHMHARSLPNRSSPIVTNSRYPDFFIIGAAKAGTTSLVEMLRSHPQVFFPHEKEPHHFFLREDDREWTIRDGKRELKLQDSLPYGEERRYLTLFDTAPADVLAGDASTQYLVNETVPCAIHAQQPDARIIVALRNPSERAYSAYLHARARGEEPCESFSQALDECAAGKRSLSFATNYLEEGLYARHLEHWKAQFGERLHVVLFEDLVDDPQGTFDLIAEFLGIDTRPLPREEGSHKNASIELTNPLARAFRLGAKRLRRWAPSVFENGLIRRPYEWLLGRLGSKPAGLSDADRARLDAYYAPHIAAIESVTGRDLSAWRS